jgi:hypothetical protein
MHNGLQLGVVADLKHQISYEAHTSNIAQMFLRSTSTAITPSRWLLAAVYFILVNTFSKIILNSVGFSIIG